MVAEDTLKGIIQAWEVAWKEGNFDALGEILTPSCVLITDEGVCSGREGKN